MHRLEMATVGYIGCKQYAEVKSDRGTPISESVAGESVACIYFLSLPSLLTPGGDGYLMAELARVEHHHASGFRCADLERPTKKEQSNRFLHVSRPHQILSLPSNHDHGPDEGQ